MESQGKNQAGIAWHVESLRFTAFLHPIDSVPANDWWVAATGDAPESKVEKPKEGTLQMEGPFKSGRLTLLIEPNRADWIFSLAFDPINNGDVMEVAPALTDVLPPFLELVHQWVLHIPPITRLAVGMVLLSLTEDRQSGYKAISSYLPDVRIADGDVSDFSCRNNHDTSDDRSDN